MFSYEHSLLPPTFNNFFRPSTVVHICTLQLGHYYVGCIVLKLSTPQIWIRQSSYKINTLVPNTLKFLVYVSTTVAGLEYGMDLERKL